MTAASPSFDDDWAAFADSALGGGLSQQVDAHLMLDELRRLDPQDRVGGALLSHVLVRREKGDDSETGTAYPVRGWSGTGPRA